MRKYSCLYLLVFKDGSADWFTYFTARRLVLDLDLSLPKETKAVTDDQYCKQIEYEVNKYDMVIG
jgi:hypothetical protein